MPTYIALLRAVNVGGRFYKMADLRAHLVDAGLTEVETHIQSGNVHLRSSLRSPARVERLVETVLGEHCGFEVPAVVLTPDELRSVHEDALAVRPAVEQVQGLRRSVTFFKPGAAPTGEVAERIRAWSEPGESAVVVGRAVHIWLDRPTQDAVFLHTFRTALAPGTNRDLKVVTAMRDRWAG